MKTEEQKENKFQEPLMENHEEVPVNDHETFSYKAKIQSSEEKKTEEKKTEEQIRNEIPMIGALFAIIIFFPIGLIALVHCLKTKKKLAKQDIAGAEKALKKAKNAVLSSWSVGILFWVFSIYKANEFREEMRKQAEERKWLMEFEMRRQQEMRDSWERTRESLNDWQQEQMKKQQEERRKQQLLNNYY